MFTGIVEATAKVLLNQVCETGRRLIVELPFENLQVGESIAVNGVCLTLTTEQAFDVSEETLGKTNLSALQLGDKVNLERALLAGSRLGGHYVSGHIDTTAKVVFYESQGEYVKLRVGGFTDEQLPFLLTKGSITINGVSLTINQINKNEIELMLVPHTIAQTTFSNLILGQLVNVEFDYMIRIVAHQCMQFLDEKNLRRLLKNKQE